MAMRRPSRRTAPASIRPSTWSTNKRQDHHRNAAEQHVDPVLGLQAGKDVIAEAGLADGGAQGRHADGPHRRGADAGHDHRRGQRQLDPEQALPRRHADAVGRLDIGGVDAEEAGDAVAQDRQHRIERQRQQRRQESERGHAEAERPGGQRRERQQQRIEQGEQSKARDRLHQARDRERGEAQPRTPRRHDRERQADRDPERQRRHAQHHVLGGIPRQQVERTGHAVIHARPSRSGR